MAVFRSLIRTGIFFALAFIATGLSAQDGLRTAFACLHAHSPVASELLGPSIVTADFNHDHHPDGAILVRNRNDFRIEVYYRFRRVSSVSFKSNLAILTISALDVNQDGSPDIVVEDPFSHQRLFVWLNDGQGGFHLASVANIASSREVSSQGGARPYPLKECIALSGTNKMRTRQADGYVDHEISLPSPIGLAQRPSGVAFSAHRSPNLVRGSPLFHS